MRQMRLKQCLGRQCGALEKYDHPYWIQRQRIKQLKKQRKEAMLPQSADVAAS